MPRVQPSYRKAQSTGGMHAVEVTLDNECRLAYCARAGLITATIILAS